MREELEALVRTPVVEVSATTDQVPDDARVLVGTEAVLHRVESAAAVAFLDFDQELLAPRYRAGEEALALLVLAARLVGGRRGSGRLVVQTRLPGHDVLQAAVLGDPARVAAAEQERRRLLGYPPYGALATVSGPAAEAYVARFGHPDGVEVLGPSDGSWLLRSPEHVPLLDALGGHPPAAGQGPDRRRPAPPLTQARSDAARSRDAVLPVACATPRKSLTRTGSAVGLFLSCERRGWRRSRDRKARGVSSRLGGGSRRWPPPRPRPR